MASQRGRMTAAVVEAVATYGYAGTTVAHIVKGARVSRETFYEHFSSKDECFLVAIGSSIDELRGITKAALDGSHDPVESLDAFLGTYLTWLSERPALAHCLLLELRGAGRPALKREAEAAAALVGRLATHMGDDDAFASELFVAALRSTVAAQLDQGRADTLPELREPLLRVVRRYLAGQPVTA